MKTLLLLLLSSPAFACPNFSGTYVDTNGFVSTLEQTSCASLVWISGKDRKSFTIDCAPHQSGAGLSSSCWKGDSLTVTWLNQNGAGGLQPFMRSYYNLDSNRDFVEDDRLTDSSGDERSYIKFIYKRKSSL